MVRLGLFAGSLPVIDVSTLRGSDAAAKATAVAEIDRACREVGFFIITNHQVPLEITQRALEATREFFDLPKEVTIMRSCLCTI